MEIRLLDVLSLAGFDPTLRTKLVRHKDRRFSVESLRQNDSKGRPWLEIYQAYQANPVFHRVQQIVSCYGLSGARAGFYGVYKVLGHVPANEGMEIPRGQEWGNGCKFFYKLERNPQFDTFRDRLIVDWGKGTINWQVWLNQKNNKEVLEMLPPGRSLPPFVDYLKFSLTYRQLRDLFRNEEAHRDWKNPLSAVSGIYLVLAETSGDMYVGSASGTSGIWGRWRVYARPGPDSGHGGNDQLRKLIAGDSGYPEGFRFSVLQILPISTASTEVIQWEQLYKQKLGSRAIGLNSN